MVECGCAERKGSAGAKVHREERLGVGASSEDTAKEFSPGDRARTAVESRTKIKSESPSKNAYKG